MDKVLNPRTNRFVKVNSQKYNRLVAEGVIKPIEKVKQTETVLPTETMKPTPEPEFSEGKLQSKLAEISTDMIKDNLKKVVQAQKLSDEQMDVVLRKLLYRKLMLNEPKKKEIPVKKKKKKKAKFKVVSSSESESESSE